MENVTNANQQYVPIYFKLQSDRYGQQSVYYKLSLNCYNFHKDKYTYEVCPFKHAKQSDNGHHTFIGHKSHWKTKNILWMDEGDHMGCPGVSGRQTLVSV